MKQKQILLCLLALLACITASAYDFSSNGIYYNITNLNPKTVEVTYKSIPLNSYSGKVVIPSSVSYNGASYSVTSIGNMAFDGCTGLTTVTIPNSVTSIGYGAFYGCSGLTSITIPESVTSIGDGAFDGTAWYNNQPDGLVYAGKVAYKYKGTMPENTPINIKDGTLGIGGSAFKGCTGLTSITIPNSVTSIGNGAFEGCSGLTSVNINCPNVGDYCFSGLSSIQSVTLGEGVISIDDYAFEGCSGLTSVTVNCPNVDYCFSGLSSIQSVTLGEGVISIGGYAFNGSSLTSIQVASGNTKYDSRGNCNAIIETATNTLIQGCKNTIIPKSVTSIGNRAFQYCIGLTSITIPESVTSIGNCAFQYCSGLTSINIPNSVTSISYAAFYGCSGLTSITIPESVTSIGVCAFYDCSSLTSLIISEGVTRIEQSAFNGCSSLTSITIPESVTNIDWDAFYNCSGLTSVTLNSDKIVSRNYGSNSINFKSIFGNQVQEYIIGNSVTSIGTRAFYGCSGLISVTIGNSVTSIGNYAFYDCSSLKEVYCMGLTMPTAPSDAFTKDVIQQATLYVRLQSYEAYINEEPWKSFGSVVAMTEFERDGILFKIDEETLTAKVIHKSGYAGEVIIPESIEVFEVTYRVNAIDDGAFLDCSEVTSVIFPESITRIGKNAFDGTAWYEAQPDGVVYWGSWVYKYKGMMPAKSQIEIEDGATSIADGAFYNCRRMSSVSFPKSLANVGDEAFSNCSGLTNITLPESVSCIGAKAFEECSSLEDVYCYAPTVPETSADAFTVEYLSDVTLHVQASAIEDYKIKKPWNEFGTIVVLTEEDTAIKDIEKEQSEMSNEAGAIYDLSGRKVAKPTKGIYIVNGRKVLIK